MQNAVTSDSVPAKSELGRFGKYHLIAALGQGGMANVFLALMPGPSGFNKLLVIKIMRHDLLAGSEDGLKMFLAEARLAARLVHPNIVHTYEVGEHDGRYFMAMEYLDGQPLSAVLNRARGEQELPLSECLRIVVEIARGLHYAHQLRGFQGEPLDVVHRDVSPQNVIVTYDGQIKLLDFGIAKSADAEQMTQVGLIKGKLDYIAPEQLRGEKIDGRADIFALGAMLWELVSGHRFAGGRKVDDAAKVQARVSGGERKLRSLRKDVPTALERLVERAIALAPEHRFQSAAELADALDDFMEESGMRASARGLAQRMGALFVGERIQMQKLIDEQVQRVKRGARPSSGSRALDVQQPESRALGLYVSEQHLDDRSSIRAMGAAPSMSGGVSPQPIHGLTWLAGAISLAAGAALVWILRNPPDAEVAEQAPPGASAPAAAAPEAPVSAPGAERPERHDPAAQTVTLQVEVEPKHARATLDGVPLSLPFTGSFPKDAALHHLELSADGFKTQKQFVQFDQDRRVELSLQRGAAHRSRSPLDELIERVERTKVEAPAEPASEPAAPQPERAKAAPVQTADDGERPNPYEEE